MLIAEYDLVWMEKEM